MFVLILYSSAIAFGRECRSTIKSLINSGKISRKARDIGIQHVELCIEYLNVYLDDLWTRVETGRRNESEAISQWYVLHHEREELDACRKYLQGLCT